MKQMLENANKYLKECDWKDLALIKFCLCAMGIMIGLSVPPKQKKKVLLFTAGVFTITYIPVMAKFLKTVCPFFSEKRCDIINGKEKE